MTRYKVCFCDGSCHRRGICCDASPIGLPGPLQYPGQSEVIIDSLKGVQYEMSKTKAEELRKKANLNARLREDEAAKQAADIYKNNLEGLLEEAAEDGYTNISPSLYAALGVSVITKEHNVVLIPALIMYLKSEGFGAHIDGITLYINY